LLSARSGNHRVGVEIVTIKIPRKLSAFLLTDALLVAGAFLIRNPNYPALATALVAAMTAFTVGHTVSDCRHVDKDGS
jgi:hypothetical protein